MRRLTDYAYCPPIETAFSYLPIAIRKRVEYVDFLTGSDPIWMGLHSYENALDGRSYRNTAHCVYPYHQWNLSKAMRKTTIVLPESPKETTPATICHEFGHVLHACLDWEPVVQPLTKYAKTDHHEAFAVAFQLWIWGWEEKKLNTIPETIALFEELAI